MTCRTCKADVDHEITGRHKCWYCTAKHVSIACALTAGPLTVRQHVEVANVYLKEANTYPHHNLYAVGHLYLAGMRDAYLHVMDGSLRPITPPDDDTLVPTTHDTIFAHMTHAMLEAPTRDMYATLRINRSTVEVDYDYILKQIRAHL